MTGHRTIVRWALTLVVILSGPYLLFAQDSPAGRVVARVLPVNNTTRTADQIRAQMHTRPGKPYDPFVAQEDILRLHKTGWFAPGKVQIETSIGADGQVTVFVKVEELTNVIREVLFMGAQHLSEKELLDLTQIRRGGPMNPGRNQLAAQSIVNKLREDGRYYASVNLLEGNNLADQRVVFQIVEGPIVRLKSVEFRGNDIASSGRLRTVVTTTGALIPGVVTPLTPKYVPQLAEEDRKKLLTYYHRLGHLDATIREEVVPSSDDISHVKLVYHISEGRPYTVRNIEFVGAKTMTMDRMKKVTGLKAGERYDLETVSADEQRLQMLFGNGGVNAVVEHAWFAVPEQPGVVDVHYKVFEPGREPDRVGRIIIEGNTITDQRVIMNQLGLLPGQVLQYPQLKNAELNLMRLGIFDMEDPPSVTVVPNEFDNGRSEYKDIRVRVKETRTGMVALTAQVNSDAGVNGSVVVNQRNFDILRVPTSLDDLFSGKAFRGGGQEMRIEAMPGQIFQRYAVTWREPFLFDSNYGLTGSGYYYNRAFAEYTEDRVGGRFALDYRFLDNQIWRANVSTRIESVNVRDVPQWASRSITDDLGHSTVLGLGAGLNRDTRDSFLLPTTGSVLNLNVEQVLGDYQFPIGTAEFSSFHTLWERKDRSGKHVVALRSQLSVMGGNAPVFERAFAGGFRSIRGFSFRGVGPVENNLNIGGTFSFLNTIEYQIPILANDKLYAVAFIDHGTVERNVAIRDYRVSVGAGLRVVVPAMGPLPIALDFAVPVTRAPWDTKQLFSFYVGWFGGQ
jgi:outer membrane protein insertion porin family